MKLVTQKDLATVDVLNIMKQYYGPGNYSSETVFMLFVPGLLSNLTINHPTVIDIIEKATESAVNVGDLGVVSGSRVDAGYWTQPDGATSGEVLFANSTALVVLQAYVEQQDKLEDVYDIMLESCENATASGIVRCQLAGDITVTRHQDSYSSKEFPWSLLLAGIGLAILVVAVGNIKACSLTFINIIVAYPISFLVSSWWTDHHAVLAFGPEIMEAIVIAFVIDYSLFLLLPFVRLKRALRALHAQGRIRPLTPHHIRAVFIIEAEVVFVSWAVLSSCFCTMFYYEFDGLQSVGMCCIITITVTALASLTLSPSLLVLLEGWGGFLLSELTITTAVRNFTNTHAPRVAALQHKVALRIRSAVLNIAMLSKPEVPSRMANSTKKRTARSYLATVKEFAWDTPKKAVNSFTNYRANSVYLILLAIIVLVIMCNEVFNTTGMPTVDGFSWQSYIKQGDVLADTIRQIELGYGPGQASRGKIMIRHNGTGVNNSTLDCISNNTGGDGLYMVRSSLVEVPNASLYTVVPPKSIRHPDGYNWYTDVLVPRLEACADQADTNEVLIHMVDAIVMDTIRSAYHDFWSKGIPTLAAVSFVCILYMAHGAIELALFCVGGVATMFIVASGGTKLVYPTYQANFLRMPGPGDNPTGFEWFPPLLVLCILIGISLDYAILRIHALLHSLHKRGLEPAKWHKAIIDDRNYDEANEEAAESTLTTTFAAGVIMIVAFIGVVMEKAPVAQEVGWLLMFGVAWTTWVDNILIQPQLCLLYRLRVKRTGTYAQLPQVETF